MSCAKIKILTQATLLFSGARYASLLGVCNMESNEKWCVAANIKKEIPYGPGGAEIKRGVRLYRGGAKIHIIGAYRGMAEKVVVIGQHRKSGKYVSCAVHINKIENFRVQKIYSKRILSMLKNAHKYNTGEAGFSSESESELFMQMIKSWSEYYV